ncbi:hypothetical protein HMPREF0183_1754 [Brevibacterium mcbrellneri ATCC 49030]|uniref:Uncharacterized protein n=1 Tax=Brevibacterium mcbrellneri ATCC 49030 TaxID=585530 RepID=D4YP94_9MICO|nr:hypothetical protein HMPREF0183_1754 [Brevibacterium mcbrellneri ATCC 49030]
MEEVAMVAEATVVPRLDNQLQVPPAHPAPQVAREDLRTLAGL